MNTINPIGRYIRQHVGSLVVAVIGLVLLSAFVIWFETRHYLRHQGASARHQPTFMLSEAAPVEAQVAAHPGKTPRTHRTNAQWLAQHQADAHRIADLESRLSDKVAHDAAHAMFAGK